MFNKFHHRSSLAPTGACLRGALAPNRFGLCRAPLSHSATTHRPIRNTSFGARCRSRTGIEIRRQNPGALYRLQCSGTCRRVSDPPNGRVGPEGQPAQSMPDHSTSTVSTPGLVGAGRVTHDTRRPVIRTKEGHYPRAAALASCRAGLSGKGKCVWTSLCLRTCG